MKDYLSDADKVYTEAMRDSWLRYRIHRDTRFARRKRYQFWAVAFAALTGIMLLASWVGR